MASEFSTAVSYYRWKNSLPESKAGDSSKVELTDERGPDNIRIEVEFDDDESIGKGTKFSSDGPAPYVGDILEQPDLLWTEDTWTSEKEEMARQRIEQQGGSVSTYWRNHYEEQAGRYWHQFYQRNQDRFYKDRHYLHIVFPELAARAPAGEDRLTLLEVGCGVGNAALPLLDVNPDLYITAVDFAKSAVQILQQHLQSGSVPAAHRMVAKVNNIVEDEAPVPPSSMNLVLCMFVLSAMSRSAHMGVFKKLFDVLKPGGKLLMRDYGRYDEAQLRFKKGSKLDDNFYVRQDGTCSYFFSLDELRSIAEEVGFEVEEMHYILRQYANRQQKKARYRVWIHAKLLKK